MLSLALTAIVVSLGLLVVVPVLVEREIASLRTVQLEVVHLAERESSQLAFALAREMALLRGFIADGDPGFVRAYWEMRAGEQDAVQRIEELEDQLPGSVAGEWREVRRLALGWHEVVESELRVESPERLLPDRVEQSLGRVQYESTLAAMARLRDSLEAARDDVLRDIAMAERFGLAVTTALALLALLATVLVVWLGRRVQRYADRARHAYADAVRANEARTRLMRGFSHDLKNPLGAVTLSAELLLTGVHGELREEQTRVVGRLLRSAEHALAVLDDLVELAQAEAGRLEIEPERLDLNELLCTVRDEHLAPAESAGLSLRLESSENVPDVVADSRRVRQILDNLVGNAINYTPGGGIITLRAGRAAAGPDGRAGSWAVVSVADTGRGIPHDQMQHVFEEFVRLPGVAGRRGGTGIGLAISRQLARLMKGDITLEAVEGRGSTFTLWLPLPGHMGEETGSRPSSGASPGAAA